MKTLYKPFSVALVAVLALLSLGVLTAEAATIAGGEEYTLSKSEVVDDDLYAAGGNILVAGSVNGDLLIAGGQVLINGPVRDDAVLAGGNVNMLGTVGDDLRAAGGNVTVGESVGGDAVLAGGNIQMLSDTTIGGDLVMAGGKMVINGDVAGNVRMVGGEATINGTVGGNVTIDSAEKVIVGNDAVIRGTLTYTSGKPADIAEGAVITGEITFNESSGAAYDGGEAAGVLAGIFGAFVLFKVLGLLVAGILAVLLFRNFSYTVAKGTLEHFGWDALRGLLVLIITPIIVVLLLATLIGAYIAALALLAYLVLIVLGCVYTGVVAGALLAQWIKKRVIVDWKWALLGIVVLAIVNLIPVIGWIVVAVFFLAVFGHMAYALYRTVWKERRG